MKKKKKKNQRTTSKQWAKILKLRSHNKLYTQLEKLAGKKIRFFFCFSLFEKTNIYARLDFFLSQQFDITILHMVNATAVMLEYRDTYNKITYSRFRFHFYSKIRSEIFVRLQHFATIQNNNTYAVYEINARCLITPPRQRGEGKVQKFASFYKLISCLFERRRKKRRQKKKKQKQIAECFCRTV